jgi:AcrR family transcriptional regulator
MAGSRRWRLGDLAVSTDARQSELDASVRRSSGGGPGRPKVRRGRPPGGSSDDTRQALVDAALRLFAERGFASTTLSSVAAETGLVTSAVYYYFESKEQLYEAVFMAVAPPVWEAMAESAGEEPTMMAGLEGLLRGRGGRRAPHVSAFMAGMPTVVTLHPELAHLLETRTKLQDIVFRVFAETGLRTGELAGLSVDQATEMLRAFIMGWMFERHFKGGDPDDNVDAVLHAFRLMTVGAQYETRKPPPDTSKDKP